MSSSKSAKPKIHQIITLALAALTIVFMVFYGSLPVSYDYVVGSIADQDIYAPRSFADTYETQRRAIVARDTSEDVFVRSDKQSQECVDRVDDFFDLAEQARKNAAQSRTTQTPVKPSVHGILQARILEWAAISFSRGSFRPGIEPRSPVLH